MVQHKWIEEAQAQRVYCVLEGPRGKRNAERGLKEREEKNGKTKMAPSLSCATNDRLSRNLGSGALHQSSIEIKFALHHVLATFLALVGYRALLTAQIKRPPSLPGLRYYLKGLFKNCNYYQGLLYHRASLESVLASNLALGLAPIRASFEQRSYCAQHHTKAQRELTKTSFRLCKNPALLSYCPLQKARLQTRV
eukprot:IDg5129t1